MWTGQNPAPGAWDAWRMAIVGIAGDRGMYVLLTYDARGAKSEEGEVDEMANRKLWFLLCRATRSPAVGIVQEFEGQHGNPDGRGAWRKLQHVYGKTSREQRPQQLLRAQFQMMEAECTGPSEASNFLVGLDQLWARFNNLEEPMSDAWKKAVLIQGIRKSMPGIFQQLVSQPQLDYAGASSVLLSSAIFLEGPEAEKGEKPLGMRAVTTCGHCGKTGHSASECWTAHPEKRPGGRTNSKCYRCNKIGHLVRNCPKKADTITLHGHAGWAGSVDHVWYGVNPASG